MDKKSVKIMSGSDYGEEQEGPTSRGWWRHPADVPSISVHLAHWLAFSDYVSGQVLESNRGFSSRVAICRCLGNNIFSNGTSIECVGSTFRQQCHGLCVVWIGCSCSLRLSSAIFIDEVIKRNSIAKKKTIIAAFIFRKKLIGIVLSSSGLVARVRFFLKMRNCPDKTL